MNSPCLTFCVVVWNAKNPSREEGNLYFEDLDVSLSKSFSIKALVELSLPVDSILCFKVKKMTKKNERACVHLCDEQAASHSSLLSKLWSLCGERPAVVLWSVEGLS